MCIKKTGCPEMEDNILNRVLSIFNAVFIIFLLCGSVSADKIRDNSFKDSGPAGDGAVSDKVEISASSFPGDIDAEANVAEDIVDEEAVDRDA